MSKRCSTVPRYTTSNATNRTKSSDTRASSGAKEYPKENRQVETFGHRRGREADNVAVRERKYRFWNGKSEDPMPGVVMAPWLFSRGNFVWRSTAGLIKCFETGRARERNKRVA